MLMKLLVVLTSDLVYVCYGHLCLISPPQRGSMLWLNKAGTLDCFLLKSPCGGRDQSSPGIFLLPGQQFTVTLQKNLDHYYQPNPGYFSISVADKNSSLQEIVRFPDDKTPPLTLYVVNVTIPTAPGHMILQARYVTQNPQAPAVFYQCTDVNII